MSFYWNYSHIEVIAWKSSGSEWVCPSLYPKAQDEKKDQCIKQDVAQKHKEFRAAIEFSHEARGKYGPARSLGDEAQPCDAPVAARGHRRTCPDQASAQEQRSYGYEGVLHTFRRNSVCGPNTSKARQSSPEWRARLELISPSFSGSEHSSFILIPSGLMTLNAEPIGRNVSHTNASEPRFDLRHSVES
jgi:hypothetical protein